MRFNYLNILFNKADVLYKNLYLIIVFVDFN